MSSYFADNGKQIWMTNYNLEALLESALGLAEQRTLDGKEKVWVEKLKQIRKASYPGMGIEVGHDITDNGEMEFWAKIFLDVAEDIAGKKVGDYTNDAWKESAVQNARDIANMLSDAAKR